LEEGQVDDTFQEAAVVEAQRDRVLAMEAGGGAGARPNRMRPGRLDRLVSCPNLSAGRAPDTCVQLGGAAGRRGIGGPRGIAKYRVDQRAEALASDSSAWRYPGYEFDRRLRRWDVNRLARQEDLNFGSGGGRE